MIGKWFLPTQTWSVSWNVRDGFYFANQQSSKIYKKIGLERYPIYYLKSFKIFSLGKSALSLIATRIFDLLVTHFGWKVEKRRYVI